MLLVPCCTPLILPVFDAVSGCGSSTSASGWSRVINIKNEGCLHLPMSMHALLRVTPSLMCIVIAHEASLKGS